MVRVMSAGKAAPFIWVVARNTQGAGAGKGSRVLVVNGTSGGLLAQWAYNAAVPAAEGVVATVVSVVVCGCVFS